jgi:hypothetical protein
MPNATSPAEIMLAENFTIFLPHRLLFDSYWLSLLKTLNAGETPGFLWLSEF